MNILRKPFRYRYDSTVFWLIGLNILVFLADKLVTRFWGQPLVPFFLSMIPGTVMHGWVWTFVTYMFVHSGVSHLFFNMFALFVFGMQVERQMGSREFLLFYFVTGVLAGMFSFLAYLLTGAWNVWLMGASGAIFAVQLAYAVFFPHAAIYIWGILPLRAPVMVIGFTALEVFFQLTGRGGNVAHVTHLAGFGFAWLYFLVRFKMNPWREMRR
ncbi:MAG: rhomboid family intramembrane serine protease [Treponema sp.]|jgi:membrane associated rhomboid family serine protease|nr:rhomboid family intramembrane serine protease [Treponema sp.]